MADIRDSPQLQRAMAATPTRTTNPLPFEHLEPKRFEDLVRQLIYDFKRWRQLEATGRSGGDSGFDARGWEAVDDSGDAAVDGHDSDSEARADEERLPADNDRLWLIQCKRERSIGPTKTVQHLDVISPTALEGLYGLVFVAACDLSKAARDACRTWCRERGIQEVHIWGRGEIEDLLYQPKNDHLLFAYFGISLQIRKRNATAALRRVTTVKRKLKRLQTGLGFPGTSMVLRDPADERYPWTKGVSLRAGQFLWRPVAAKTLGARGLRVVTRCFHGFYLHETQEWDVASINNRATPFEARTLWNLDDDGDQRGSSSVIHSWGRLPQQNQAFLYALRDLPYEEILEVDEIGDDVCALPTLFTTFKSGEPPYLDYGEAYLEVSSWGRVPLDHTKRVRLFADHERDPAWEARWSEGTGAGLPSERYQFQMPDGTAWIPGDPSDGEGGL